MTIHFAVADPAIPSLASVPILIETTPDYPEATRRADIALIRKVGKWSSKSEGRKGTAGYHPGIEPTTVAFTKRDLARLFAQMKPGVLGVTRKTMANAQSICHRIVDTLGIADGLARAPLSTEARSLHDLLKSAEDRGSCARILRFLSSRGIDPASMSDDLLPAFRQEIEADWHVEDKEREYRRSLYAWNSAAAAFPDEWPQIKLKTPIKRVVWGKPWSYFPEFERAADAYFARRLPGGDLFEEGYRLKPVSVSGQKETLRRAACALLYDGVPREQLVDLRSVVTPERYDRALRALRDRAGAVNGTVNKYARDLASIGKRSGVLVKEERKAVKKSLKKWRLRFAEFKKTYEDRDQALLDSLDDPKIADALLSLATRTVETVRRRQNHLSVGSAYEIQKALVLELWLCAPIRISNVLGLQLNRHFSEVTLAGEKWVALRLKPNETKNVNGEEHFLNKDAAHLLELYISVYRPIILKRLNIEDSDFLFPGEDGGPKTYQSKAKQMNRWIAKHTGLKFHPHAIRKIVPKLILDVDPSAIEAAVSAGGWKDDTMLRRIYGQRMHRPTQRRYIELLEGRRLTALGALKTRSKRRGGN